MPRIWLLIPLLAFLYLYGLGDVGLVGPDEPRYASIGREMAQSGDWVTPRLWGAPWYEKPALLYWMIGGAYRVGLKGEWAARLPVALASLIFLGFFYALLRREFGAPAALYATLILGTSAGWLAYSFAALTDLPMAAPLMAGVLMTGGVRSPSRAAILVAGALLGVAALAKGLVPLVLFVPVLWFVRSRRRDLLLAAGTFLAVALPWYLLCYLRNGRPFLYDFFWVQHFARFTTTSLQHVQPAWFFVPVLAAGLFPWTPLAALVFRKGLFADRRLAAMAAYTVFGLVFFSASRNKLPGYLLPLIPAVAVLAGVALSSIRNARWWLLGCGALSTGIPTAAGLLPEALRAGLSHATLHPAWVAGAPFLLAAAAAWWLEAKCRRGLAVAAIAVAVTAGVTYLKLATFPVLDREASARGLWRKIASREKEVCLEDVNRTWVYGLNYYSVKPLPDCLVEPRPLRIRDADFGDGGDPAAR